VRGQVQPASAIIAIAPSANAAMIYAYEGGLLSLVSVIASLYPAATVLLAMVMLGERVGALQKVGMALALGAIAMIALAG
jgi:drug/metabolite transporter (DMT)-like permease